MKKSKVIVPDHIAKEVEEKSTKNEESKSEIDKAFVSAEERVLDPT